MLPGRRGKRVELAPVYHSGGGTERKVLEAVWKKCLSEMSINPAKGLL